MQKSVFANIFKAPKTSPERDHTKTFVISLARTPERYEEFGGNNATHKTIERFDAIDGNAYSLRDLERDSVVAPPLEYSRGALGNALSHRRLWEYAIENQVPVTICEDDAYLHDSFFFESERLLLGLERNWDLVYWGWNFDSVLLADIEPRLSSCLMHFDQDALRRNKYSYLHIAVQPSLMRLRAAFGSMCYSISPAGAKKFLEFCFPLRQAVVEIPELNFTMANVALDAMMCNCFRQTSSWACFPPLAVTDNDHATSTVQTAARSA